MVVRLAVLLGVRAVVAARLLVDGAGRLAVVAGVADLVLAFATFEAAGAFFAYAAPLLPVIAVQVPSGQHEAGAQLSQAGGGQHGGGQQRTRQHRRQPRAEASLVSMTNATNPTPAIIQAFFIVQVSIVEVSYPPYTASRDWSVSGPFEGVAIRGKANGKSRRLRRIRWRR